MIQDIFPLHMKNQYENRTPGADSRLMVFKEDQILVRQGKKLDFLTYGELVTWCVKLGAQLPRTIYLFSIESAEYFLTELPREVVQKLVRIEQTKEADKDDEKERCVLLEENAASEYEFVRMFAVRSRMPKAQVFAAATAWHLHVWYRDHQYCGRCAKKLEHSERLRMLFCPCCGNEIYPKIAPAVIVGVTRGEHILMTKYANREYKRYALIAGFTEIGETAEETVAREVFEEVGLFVKNIRYYKSQPWGFDSNLLLGYFCEWDELKGTDVIVMDEEELAEAEWVHYSDIPEDAEGLSLTREMMTVFKQQFESGK